MFDVPHVRDDLRAVSPGGALMRAIDMRKALFAAVIVAPVAASADPAPAPVAAAPAAAEPATAAPDLRLHQSPVHLRMRVRLQDKVPITTAQTTKPPPPDADATSAKSVGDGGALTSTYHPIPIDKRDLQERVIFKVNAGYQLDNAPASGETLRGGAALPDGFANQRNWIVGDAVVGTRDVLLPSLNAYFLASYQYDTSNALASRTATISPTDATGQNLAIKFGYAEYGTEDKDDNHFWLRAGRQTRQDGGAMFAYFDGATVGYRNSDFSISAFGGERVALYIDTPTGTTYGATASLDLKKSKNIPVKLGIDYEALTIATGTVDVPTIDTSVDNNTTNVTRQLLAASGNIDLGKKAHLDLKVRFVDGGPNAGIPLGVDGAGVAPNTSGGFAFGRASAHLKVVASNDVMIVADVTQRGGGDLAYDLATPTNVDVVDIARQAGLGVGLYQPTDATMLSAQIDYRHGNHELLAFGKLNATEGTVVTADQEGYVEGGAAIAGSPLANTWITGQYKYRAYFLNGFAANVDNMQVQLFGDTSTSGLDSMHELSLDGWWRSSSRDHRVRLGGGLFYRVYNLVSPYETTNNDGRGGARADIQLFLTQELHLLVAGEIAQPDPTLMREIGTMESVRAAVEARW